MRFKISRERFRDRRGGGKLAVEHSCRVKKPKHVNENEPNMDEPMKTMVRFKQLFVSNQ